MKGKLEGIVEELTEKQKDRYLEQNLLSEMAKADINKKVRPEFKEIYELLHSGIHTKSWLCPPRCCTILNPSLIRA